MFCKRCSAETVAIHSSGRKGQAAFPSVFASFCRCEILCQFGFDFLDGGQAAAQFFGQGFGELRLPGGDGDGLVQAAQGLFGDEFVFLPAKQQADRGLVVGVAQEVVHGGEVEIELADIAGGESAGF